MTKNGGTPALTGYSCHPDFSSRTTQSYLLLRKEKIRPNIWLEIPQHLNLWRPTCQTLSKALDISSATARAALDLLKAIALLSDTIVRRSTVDQEDLKPHWKSEIRRPHFSWISTILLFTSFSKNLVTTERRLTGW